MIILDLGNVLQSALTYFFVEVFLTFMVPSSFIYSFHTTKIYKYRVIFWRGRGPLRVQGIFPAGFNCPKKAPPDDIYHPLTCSILPGAAGV